MNNTELVWHYTTGDCHKLIIEDGFLRPTAIYVPDGEKPILWFSQHPYWEPTATKGIIGENGKRRNATLTEMIEHAGGLVRFGALTDWLKPWPEISFEAGMARHMRRNLVKTAKQAKSNPKDWYGTVHPLALTYIDAVETMNADMNWVSSNE